MKELYKSVQIENKIEEIAYCMENSTNDGLGLMGGKAGEVLFWAYYSRYSDNKKYEDRIIKLLSDIFNNENSFPAYAGGLAGIGWTTEHLVQNEFIEADTNELFSDLDTYLYNCMMHYMRLGQYDYLHGALGIALYFINRKNNPKSKDYLINLVYEIENQSIKNDSCISWESRLRLDEEIFGINLSLSHGLASIINVLSRIYNLGIAQTKIKNLVEGAVNYLFQVKNNRESLKYQFPGWIAKEEKPGPGRLAWCYNDLGIGISLWYCGNLLNNSNWKKKANEILLPTTNIGNKKDAGIRDAGICHGAFGIAHIYNRMFNYSANNIYKEKAQHWLKEGLDMAVFEDGLAGYKVYRTEEYGGYSNDYGFLTGITGIGLALISAASKLEPNWDECILLS